MSEKQDLRVVRTEQAIRTALLDMIMETDYHEITVKELARRAMINRNTFYLHYPSVDALMEEFQNEIAETFLSMYVSYDSMEDVKEMIRRFFVYVTSHSPLMERIFFRDSYRFIAAKISARFSAYREQTRHGVFGVSEPAEHLMLSYCGGVGMTLYRQWVADGKKLPLEELLSLATDLICNGMKSVIDR